MNSAQLLPAIRDLYSRHPETYHLEPWELQHVHFSLGYTDDLADEAEIAAAVEVAHSVWPRRSSDLQEAWRRNHPSEREEGGKGRPKKRHPA